MPSTIKPSQFRLGPEVLAHLDAIAARYGLTSRTDAIRLLVAAEMRRNQPAETPPKNPRKSKQGA